MICDRCNGVGRITHPAIKGDSICPKCEGRGFVAGKDRIYRNISDWAKKAKRK